MSTTTSRKEFTREDLKAKFPIRVLQSDLANPFSMPMRQDNNKLHEACAIIPVGNCEVFSVNDERNGLSEKTYTFSYGYIRKSNGATIPVIYRPFKNDDGTIKVELIRKEFIERTDDAFLRTFDKGRFVNEGDWLSYQRFIQSYL